MDETTAARIQEIELAMAEIDIQIRALEAEKQEVLESDEEYASYVEHYRYWFDDEPLTIRQYYDALAELREINAQFDAVTPEHHRDLQNPEYDRLYRKHRSRLLHLESRLAM